MSGLPKITANDAVFTLEDEEDETLGHEVEEVDMSSLSPPDKSRYEAGELRRPNSVHMQSSSVSTQPRPTDALKAVEHAEAGTSPASRMERLLAQEVTEVNGNKTEHSAAKQEEQEGPRNGQAAELTKPQGAAPAAQNSMGEFESQVNGKLSAAQFSAVDLDSAAGTSTDAQSSFKQPAVLPQSAMASGAQEGQNSAASSGQAEHAAAEADEQRIADELAALEAEAEALALQEQRASVGRHPDAAVDLNRYSVSLADQSRSADRAMAEAHRLAQQMSSGAAAMQSALDSYEAPPRPFSPPPGSAPLQRFSPVGEFVEPPEFQGLLYCDGLDSLGRPVVVINADAVAEDKGARKAAFEYLLHQLEPVVTQGPYVLVMVNTGRSHKSNRLQASWLVSAYRGLSRPFRKNVKFIVLVRPSKPLKAFLTVLRPFLSRKAHRKVIKVESLSGIAEATGQEVALQHLGARFASAAGRSVSDDLSLTEPTLRGGSSPMFSSSPH